MNVFEKIYNIAQIKIEIENAELKGDDELKGTFFEGCTSKEMTEELKTLLKIQGLALNIINKHNT